MLEMAITFLEKMNLKLKEKLLPSLSSLCLESINNDLSQSTPSDCLINQILEPEHFMKLESIWPYLPLSERHWINNFDDFIIDKVKEIILSDETLHHLMNL